MKRKRWTRTTEIKVETEELYLLRRSGKPVRAWCPACAAEVRMLTADGAAAAAGVSTRTIYRWVERGKIHFTETGQGQVLICLNSLA